MLQSFKIEQNQLKILSLNCRSLYNKLSEIKLFIYKEKPHIICLTETWCKNDRIPNFINYNGSFLNRDGGRGGGGIAMLTRSDIVALPSQLTNYNDSIEIQKTRIKLNQTHIDIFNIYEPTGQIDYETYKRYFDQFENKFIAVGDFNAHHPTWSHIQSKTNNSGKTLNKILNEYTNISLATPKGMQTYLSSTTGNTSTLDLCFCSSDVISDISVNTGPCLGSDHYPIKIEINMTPSKQPIKFRRRYKLQNVDWDKWQIGLKPLISTEEMNLEEKYSQLVTCIKSSSEEIHLTKGEYIPKYNINGWDSECSKLVAIRRKAKNNFKRHPTDSNLRKLRIAENIVKEKLKEKKESSWRVFASSINKHTKLSIIWNKIRSLSNKFKPSNLIIDHNNSLITDPVNKAEVFADYFQERLSKIFINPNKNEMTMFIQGKIIEEDEEKYNTLFTKTEMMYCISKLKTTSPGADNIENIFLKNLSREYQTYLLNLLNESFIKEDFPKLLKEALLVPIAKPNKDPHKVSSYRPISMLSCIGKLLERMINNRLDWFLEQNNALNVNQSGFRRRKGTNDQLTLLENEIQHASASNKTTIVVFLDLASAFDNVSHVAVLYKLAKMGVKGRLLGWLQSYLNERTFKVLLEGHESSIRDTKSGVPQGGILSPLLFNVLISDFPSNSDISVSMFADDIAIYMSDTNEDNILMKMQNYLDEIVKYLDYWNQEVNISKCKVMKFSKKTNKIDNLLIKNEPLKYVNNYKFLGMIFDSPSLKWMDHINNIKLTCNKRISILKSLSHQHWGSDRETLIMIYRSLIQSRIDYGSHLYHNATQTLLKTLEPIQNQCLKIAAGLRHTTPTVSVQVETNTAPLNIRRKHLILKYYAKILENPPSAPLKIKILKYKYRKYEYKGFFNNCNKIINEWSVRQPPITSCKAVPPIPPWKWELTDEYGDMFHPNYDKENFIEINMIFNELINEKYQNAIAVYTDGSKSDSKCGAAYYIPKLNIKKKLNLDPQMSILTAELIAILKAVKIANARENDYFVIMTDSLSSIALLKNKTPQSHRHIIYEIQKVIKDKEDKIKFQWIPSGQAILIYCIMKL